MQFIRPKIDSRNQLRIISLGGFGNVTTNMYVYELLPQGDILLIDCGIGFPSEEMLGVDLLIPDTSYLKDKIGRIKGLVLTHGHDDHTGALPFILPHLPVPVYAASPLTAGFAQLKLQDSGLTQRIIVVDPSKSLKLGQFTLDFIRINHSTPDAQHIFIQTPIGNIYHGPDYKFDWTPVDGVKPDLAKIVSLSAKGVTLMLTDCLGAENKGPTPSESILNETFERELNHWKGRIIITTLSSNISRFHQAITASINHQRKVILVGRSLENKVELAIKLGYLKFPRQVFVTPEQSLRLPDSQITYLVSGSQGQPGSALDRVANSEHKTVQIKKSDKIIFSSPDYIPGTEGAVHSLIDRFTKLGANVIYSNIAENLHVGGHGGQHDMMLLLVLAKPRYIVPTGGEMRHMKQYSLMAQKLGYEQTSILIPQNGEIVEVTGISQVAIKGKIEVRNILVDGLGVGDVGQVVLRDRQVLAEEGIVVVVIQLDQVSANPIAIDIISRGFVYGKSNEQLINQAKKEAQKAITSQIKTTEIRVIRERVIEKLGRFFFSQTGRRPMVLPVVVEV